MSHRQRRQSNRASAAAGRASPIWQEWQLGTEGCMTKLPSAPAKVTKLPAKSEGKRYAAFDDFLDDGRKAGLIYDKLDQACDDIYPHCPGETLKRAEQMLADYQTYDRRRVERFKKQIEEFDPEDAYEE